MGWIRCVRCKNVRRDFVGRTFALIAAIQAVFHRVLCSNKAITNAPKHYEMHKNMSLGSNVVDQVCSLQIFPTRLRWPNFCNNCTKVRLFCIDFCAIMKRSQMHPNTMKHTKHEFRVQWGGSGVFVAKTSHTTSRHELMH